MFIISLLNKCFRKKKSVARCLLPVHLKVKTCIYKEDM